MEKATIDMVGGGDDAFQDTEEAVLAALEKDRAELPPAFNESPEEIEVYGDDLVADEPIMNDEPIAETINQPVRISRSSVEPMRAEDLLEASFDKRLTEEEINVLAQENNRKGVSELFNADGIALKSELNPIETVRFSQLLFMANRYEIAGIDDFVNNLLQLKVSLMRKGRGEFIQGLHAEERRTQMQDMSPIQALMSKLGGG
jgi:hypothetical protein